MLPPFRYNPIGRPVCSFSDEPQHIQRMTFADWQLLGPQAAAREIRRRVEERLDPLQRRAVFACVPDEAARAAAFAAAPPGSPLRGVPYALKDMFDVSGFPTYAGSSFLPEVRPAPSAESRVVHALR